MIQVDGIFVQQGGSGPVIPDFSYTGEYQLVNENDGNWKLYLITSGTFTPNVNMTVDVCLFGGGQGGSGGGIGGSLWGPAGAPGAPGESNTTRNIVLEAGKEYVVSIGAGSSGGFGNAPASSPGGATSFGTFTVNGGSTANGITAPQPEFGEEGQPTQAALGGNGGTSASAGAPGGDAGSESAPENGGAGGNGGANASAGGTGSRGATGGTPGYMSGNPRSGGGGGGGGFGASGGGGGGNYGYAANSNGGTGAPGVAILRNARGVAA